MAPYERRMIDSSLRDSLHPIGAAVVVAGSDADEE
jgi:hypothetical protein